MTVKTLPSGPLIVAVPADLSMPTMVTVTVVTCAAAAPGFAPGSARAAPVTTVVPGVSVDGGFFAYLWIAALFAIINVTIGPVLRLLSAPLFLITLGLLAALMVWYGFAPGWQILTLPLFAMLAFGLSLGLGLLLAALMGRGPRPCCLVTPGWVHNRDECRVWRPPRESVAESAPVLAA